MDAPGPAPRTYGTTWLEGLGAPRSAGLDPVRLLADRRAVERRWAVRPPRRLLDRWS
jgi:hypothetical protein